MFDQIKVRLGPMTVKEVVDHVNSHGSFSQQCKTAEVTAKQSPRGGLQNCTQAEAKILMGLAKEHRTKVVAAVDGNSELEISTGFVFFKTTYTQSTSTTGKGTVKVSIGLQSELDSVVELRNISKTVIIKHFAVKSDGKEMVNCLD